MNSEPKIDVTWVYGGRRITSKGVLAHAFFDIEELRSDGREAEGRIYSKVKKRVVGGRYQGKTSPGKEIAYGLDSWKFVGKLSDEHLQSLIVEWDAADTAAYAEDVWRKEERKAKRFPEMYAVLDPIKRVYQDSSGPGRRAILLKVLSYIQGGKH